MRETLDELWVVVASIPPGRVASYGDVGRALSRPATGYQVGRWMAHCPAWVPWWRVVGKDGRLPVWKRDPALAVEQRRRLIEEGVSLGETDVAMDAHGFVPELLST